MTNEEITMIRTGLECKIHNLKRNISTIKNSIKFNNSINDNKHIPTLTQDLADKENELAKYVALLDKFKGA